jgi:hypothetical protein
LRRQREQHGGEQQTIQRRALVLVGKNGGVSAGRRPCLSSITIK